MTIARIARSFALFLLASAIAAAGFAGASESVVAAAPPSPSPSPTQEPTPFMPIEVVANGSWQIILQPRSGNPSYSTMMLKNTGTTISGSWWYDKKTTYVVSGTREGSRLKLELRASAAPDAAVIGKIDATIDGIADMYGSISLNGVETAFQGAQHSRVPPPIDSSSPGPARSPR